MMDGSPENWEPVKCLFEEAVNHGPEGRAGRSFAVFEGAEGLAFRSRVLFLRCDSVDGVTPGQSVFEIRVAGKPLPVSQSLGRWTSFLLQMSIESEGVLAPLAIAGGTPNVAKLAATFAGAPLSK
jgi:hypothetical protein